MKKLASIVTAVCLALLTFGPAAGGQVSSKRLETLRSRLHQAKTFFDRMPETRRQVLSGATQNLIRLADMWEKEGGRPGKTLNRPTQLSRASSGPAAPGGVIPVSDPSNDFAFSLQTGFTQSETSTAWCGSHVVVGFNDSGSIAESLFSGPGGVGLSGVALSTDYGHRFHDLGFVNPGSNPANFLAGDPVLGCADASTFYYAQLFETADSSGNPLTAVAISPSFDGGATWGDPVAAVSKDGFTHFLDKDWMAVDPTNSSRLFVTYTDFDFSGVFCGTSASRIAIELVSSTNGGATWGAPVVLDEVCSPFSVPGLFPQVSQVAVGPAGEVYVAWEFFQADFFTREIRVRKSTNHGVSFGTVVNVDDVTHIGDAFAIQGAFRTFIDLGSLVVDRSGTSTNGNVYITWHDGRNLQVPDFASFSGFYGYADVLIRRSSNGGATWSPPARVNTNDEPLPSGRGTDQYQPGVAVDNTGKVAVCWYDRRHDPLNFFVDRFCGVSTDAGATWTNTRQSSPSWAPIHATDVFINPIYLGDYDTLASDFTQSTPGFIGAFQMMSTRGGLSGNSILVPNPDVFATSFK